MTPFYDIEKTQTGLSSRMKDAVDFLKCLHVVLSVGDHKELGPHRTDSVGDCREYACPGDQRCKTKVSHILAKTFHRSDSLPVLIFLDLPVRRRFKIQCAINEMTEDIQHEDLSQLWGHRTSTQ